MDINFNLPGQGQPAYKAGAGQQKRKTGPLPAGTTVRVIFDTAMTGVGRGTGLLSVEQPSMGPAWMTTSLDAKNTKTGLNSISYTFPRDVKLAEEDGTLVQPTFHEMIIVLDLATSGINIGLNIQGTKTPRAA